MRISWTKPGSTLTLVVAFLAGPAPAPAAGEPAAPGEGRLAVRKLGDPGPLEIVDGDRPVLRYNYQIVPLPADVKPRIGEGNLRYAVDRCDYIHPLYGPDGEVLTDDWLIDHPHHRGIYWAWPEVDWDGKRGDLHALQVVFARPTGKVRIEEGRDSVAIVAESEWRWEDRTPIVREEATIRAYRKTAAGRAIDLTFRFVAVDAEVKVARRGTAHYGGLNIRLAPAPDQKIETHTDPADASPRRAWSYRTGVPRGGSSTVGLAVLQHPDNPDFPGDWVQYPELSWVQPTFPAANTRWTIAKERPLVLRYRAWVTAGKLTPEEIGSQWDAFRAAAPAGAAASPIPAGAKAEKLAEGFAFTEGPAVDAEGNVFFTDQPNDRILKWGIDGKLSTFLQPCGRSNGMYFDADGNLLACADEKNELWSIDRRGRPTVLVKDYGGKLLNGPNDLWVHPGGAIYFTDPLYKRDYWKRGPMEQDGQHVYRLSPDRKEAVRVATDLVQPNGIVGTPDGKTLYVADIGAGKTYAYDIAADGSLTGKRLFCSMGSDGMTLDERGNVYLTGRGVTVFDAAGKKIDHVDVPEPWTANVCFGGKDRKTLFITASQRLYAVRTDVRGAAPPPPAASAR